jgi:hypothetical protein
MVSAVLAAAIGSKRAVIMRPIWAAVSTAALRPGVVEAVNRVQGIGECAMQPLPVVAHHVGDGVVEDVEFGCGVGDQATAFG